MSGSFETSQIEAGGGSTSLRRYDAKAAQATLVLAHGAGAPQSHPWMVAMAHAITRHEIEVFTFDFLYTHAKRRSPDRPQVLESTWKDVFAAVRARKAQGGRRLLVGGKSMGGRIATQVAAQRGFADVSGIVLLGYPLHPPGNPRRLRAAHLPNIDVPMLFVQGSRDSFGTPAELAPIVADLPNARLLVIEGGDHSLTPTKGSSEDLSGVMDRVAAEIALFAQVS